MRRCACLIAVLAACGAVSPAWGQSASGITVDSTLDELPPPQPTPPVAREGQIAESAVGQAGLRQTRSAVDGLNPLDRIGNRLQNRVQTRVRNRIDRNYDPLADAASPFEQVDQTVRRTTPRPR